MIVCHPLQQVDTTDENVDEVADMVEVLTNDTDILTSTDVAYASHVMMNVADVRDSGKNVSQSGKILTCCMP
jgi:predicted protein tyrosine phosphatase